MALLSRRRLQPEQRLAGAVKRPTDDVRPDPKWTTDDELMYLTRLIEGDYTSQATYVGALSPRTMVARYAAAAMRRANWGEVDRERVLSAALSLL